MPIDPYTPCPGGTGKKVKFCCPDLLGELDDVQKMLEGDQRLACLEHIGTLEAKFPDRACLMSMKVMLEAQLADEGKAEATLARFKDKYPGNPVALAEDAALKAAKAGGKAAVEPLQQAIAASANAMTPQVFDAIGVVAERLLADGQYLSAMGHLTLLSDLSGGKDERSESLLRNLVASPQLPLLMKEDQLLAPAPEGALWKSAFDKAMELVRSARWADAAQALSDLAKTAGDWPPIWRNIATLRLWLADNSGAVVALRKFARQPLGSSAAPPLDEMVEAEALAQIIDPDSADFTDVLTITFPVNDAEAVIARLSADPRCPKLPIDLAQLATDDQPPPKLAVWILDRATAASGKGIAREQVSMIVGQAFLFGKQTDREARLELVTFRTDELTESRKVLAEVLGDAVGAASNEQVTSRTPTVRHAISWNWQLPDDTPPAEREALLDAERQRTILEKWPAMQLKLLDGRTPQEAARDPAMRVPLLAAVLVLELSSMSEGDTWDYNALRGKLNLPATSPIELTDNALRELPLARLHRVDVNKLTDEELLFGYVRAVHFRHVTAIRRFGDEILRRPSLDGTVPKQEIYGQLAQIERDPQQAIEYIDRARAAAEGAGQSSAPWDIAEMTLRMSMGDVAEADRLMQHIRNEHIREPGVTQMLMNVLVEAGIIRPDGSPAMQPRATAGEAAMAGGTMPASEAGKLWTPGAEAAPAGAKKSVIWTPD
jgi:hypothetical protein